MRYLNKKYYIWILIGVSVLFYWGYINLFPLPKEPDFLDYIKPIPTVVGFDTFVAFIFSKWFWKCKLFYKWLVPFPNLNGTWKGYIKSNWIDPKTGKKPEAIPTILTIEQSLSNISCVMRTGEMRSFSFISGFVIDFENQILKLVYTYDSIPKQTIKYRSPQHMGTMYFDVIKNKGKWELIGDYWTARETTGRVELSFWKKERIEKYPEKLGKHPVSKIRKDEE